MRDLATIQAQDVIHSAEQARQRFELLTEEFRLQADRYAEHAAELAQFLEAKRSGKPAEYPQGAWYAGRCVRLFVPEGRIVVPAPKHRVVVTLEPKE
jgi:hypothetical protein